MTEELIILIKSQSEELEELLKLLETQYKMIMEKDVFGLEGLVDKLNECSKRIAQSEMNRRKLLGNESISELVKNSNNIQLKDNYSNIQDVLNKVMLQKDTNDLLLKQQIMFNNKMINIINPNREIKTYNSYGNLSK